MKSRVKWLILILILILLGYLFLLFIRPVIKVRKCGRSPLELHGPVAEKLVSAEFIHEKYRHAVSNDGFSVSLENLPTGGRKHQYFLNTWNVGGEITLFTMTNDKDEIISYYWNQIDLFWRIFYGYAIVSNES